jgi:predicted MPP superfamily phosphohydrolase
MKNIIPYLFASSVLAIFAVAIIYMSRRFAGFFGNERAIPYYVAFSLLIIFMIYGVLALSNSTEQSGHLLYSSAAVIMGFILYLLLSVITVDILRIFITIPPRFGATIAIGLATIVSVYGVWNSTHIRTSNITVPISQLNKDVRILHLSDIHIGHFRGIKTISKIVSKANALNPDIIAITGDLFDGKIGVKEEIFDAIKQFKAPVYFVEGNHDEYTNIRIIKNKLRKIGVNVLDNIIEDFGDLQIVGINHMQADNETYDMHASGHKPTIEETLHKLQIDSSRPSVLLHHSPEGIKYADKHGIDLYLTGHTHAGQMFPINLIAELIFPYNRGLHNYNNTKIYVSEGIGTFGPPMRVGTISEMVLLTLKSAK